tara:strand:- start:1118 stop:1342 length:225 start_codon:yes stop_codon:yes gene_type:complete
MSKVNISQLKTFVENHAFNNESFELNKATIITDKKKFAQSHLEILLANSGKSTFTPYYTRLLKLYEHENKKLKP